MYLNTEFDFVEAFIVLVYHRKHQDFGGFGLKRRSFVVYKFHTITAETAKPIAAQNKNEYICRADCVMGGSSMCSWLFSLIVWCRFQGTAAKPAFTDVIIEAKKKKAH